MVFDSLVLFLGVVLSKLVKIFLFHELWQTLTRVHILVDLHEHFVRIGNHRVRHLTALAMLLNYGVDA